jgi:hypothetical protein
MHLAYGWHSHPQDVARTKQEVMTAAQALEHRLHSRLPLPTNTNEFASALGGNIPRDAWGQPLSYQQIGPTNFIVSAMSPYPELLIISYDSRDTGNQVTTYPF